MNSNTVLGKIMTLLSLQSEGEIKLAFAKLADGTLLESPTFDVGESVEVVSEDGTKSPAPDGEHELELTGEEGETVRFKIITEGGVITERENVELEEEEISEEDSMEAETVEAEPLPGDPTEMSEEVAEEEEEKMEEEMPSEEEKEVTINLEEVSKKVEEMAYRIDELEKKLDEKMEEVVEEVAEEEEKMEEEVEDKKLDGAPVEMARVAKKTPKHTTKNYHNSVLSKMYR